MLAALRINVGLGSRICWVRLWQTRGRSFDRRAADVPQVFLARADAIQSCGVLEQNLRCLVVPAHFHLKHPHLTPRPLNVLLRTCHRWRFWSCYCFRDYLPMRPNPAILG